MQEYGKNLDSPYIYFMDIAFHFIHDEYVEIITCKHQLNGIRIALKYNQKRGITKVRFVLIF